MLLDIWATKGTFISFNLMLCFGLYPEFYEEQPQKLLLSGVKLSRAFILWLSIPCIRARCDSFVRECCTWKIIVSPEKRRVALDYKAFVLYHMLCFSSFARKCRFLRLVQK